MHHINYSALYADHFDPIFMDDFFDALVKLFLNCQLFLVDAGVRDLRLLLLYIFWFWNQLTSAIIS
ncbi:uncharacterized protein PHALS_02425 [Plasmopara halstedii]|uniref:Uncharacterized protein n=1 Tax=Plasmopara halstedii TaxID=4781 RepID=A0A0P1A6U2_PLAHL|nr:uncharacterized protein PHALS_02425 [Plasmopara halstedii]CEG36335.1 hypothetical protein PHALS_02425 [Plasmopara halstedii]|eukprot:XP_024572704.1 hypothetical protein PHALS_02425 [Plasmopara halstedii]